MKNIDNPFFAFMGRLGDLILLNLLFIVTSLPIITIGMSLTSLYRVTLRIHRGECSYAAREYLRSCREEWKGSVKLWLFYLLFGCLLGFNLYYSRNLSAFYAAALGGVFVIWYVTLLYVFWLQARFENSFRGTLKNALILSLRHFPATILMGVLNAVPLLCVMMGEAAMNLILPIYLAVGFSLTAWAEGFLMRQYLDKMIHTPETEVKASDAEKKREKQREENVHESFEIKAEL